MSTPLLCLLGFAGWTLLLVLGVITWRSALVLVGRKRSSEFKGGVEHGDPLYWRLNRAHVNSVENLAVFGALVVTGTLARVATPTFSTLCQAVLAARIAQSLLHLASNAVPVVNARFAAFVVQWASMAWMLVEILRHAAPIAS
jgi:uncharacterized MAPEG superfamily protein